MNDGGSVFPSERDRVSYENGLIGRVVRTEKTPGMSLRDYFAAKAMQAICFRWTDGMRTPLDDPHDLENLSKSNAQVIAENAYFMADAMLKARETTK